MTSKLGELRSLLPGGQPKEPTVWDEISESTSMSKKTRLRVFAVLFVLSTILSFTVCVLVSVFFCVFALCSKEEEGRVFLLSRGHVFMLLFQVKVVEIKWRYPGEM